MYLFMESCPSCRRKFNEAIDYPFINIRDFQRFPVPEIVFGAFNYQEFLHFNELPWIVRRRFKKENIRTTNHRGYVYKLKEYSDIDVLAMPLKHRVYQSGKDFRKEAIDALDNKSLVKFLESFERNVGKSVELDGILKRTYMRDGFRSTFCLRDIGKGQEAELAFDDQGVLDGRGSFYIHLVGVSKVLDANTRDSLYFRRVPIVRVGYEGRLER